MSRTAKTFHLALAPFFHCPHLTVHCQLYIAFTHPPTHTLFNVAHSSLFYSIDVIYLLDPVWLTFVTGANRVWNGKL